VDPAGSAGRSGSPARRRYLVRVLLVAAFGLGLAAFVPGIAQAEGEQVAGTLQTSRSGPIEGVEMTVTTAAGQEVDSVETDEQGR
jgi:neutral amino acid transport system permease protein